jgi:hypothetical protein
VSGDDPHEGERKASTSGGWQQLAFRWGLLLVVVAIVLTRVVGRLSAERTDSPWATFLAILLDPMWIVLIVGAGLLNVLFTRLRHRSR